MGISYTCTVVGDWNTDFTAIILPHFELSYLPGGRNSHSVTRKEVYSTRPRNRHLLLPDQIVT